MIAIRAYQETDLLLGKLDVYAAFKHINPVDAFADQVRSNLLKSDANNIYNPSVENFLVFAMEALLQRDMESANLELGLVEEEMDGHKVRIYDTITT